MQDRETRAFVCDELRINFRSDDDPSSRTIVGHAAVFDQLSEDLGGFREKIAPGTFAETIKTDDVRALFNHSPDWVLGRKKAGTLRLAEDKIGLKIEIDPPDTGFARDLAESISRGDIDQMSFGFRTISDEWEQEDEQIPIRTLTKVQLLDVSPVTFPAYPDTDVGLRSLQAILKDKQLADANKLSTLRKRQRQVALLRLQD